MVDGVGANRTVGIEAQNIIDRAGRGPAWRDSWRAVDRLVEEKWNVFRQILQHAVRGLIRVDTISRANDRLA